MIIILTHKRETNGTFIFGERLIESDSTKLNT